MICSSLDRDIVGSLFFRPVEYFRLVDLGYSGVVTLAHCHSQTDFVNTECRQCEMSTPKLATTGLA